MPLYNTSPQAPADLPTGAIAHTFPRAAGLVLTSGLASGTLRLSGVIRIPAQRTVTSVSVFSGTTALASGSNQWFGLFDTALAKLALTTDDTSTAWAGGTVKTLNLASPYTPAADTLVLIGALVVAVTPPSLVTPTSGTYPHLFQAPIVGGTSSTGLTNPASCPATVATPAGGASPFYAWIS